MARSDYALCAHCDGKAFYDADTDTHDTVTFHPDCLAAHDRAVKAEALREAADDWGDITWQDVWAADGVEDDVSAVQSTVKWLHARADSLGGDRG